MKRSTMETVSTIKIEKGIPIPNPGVKYGHWTLVADKMEVGDSVLLEGADKRKAIQKALGLKNAVRKLGKDCVTRTVSETAIRLWCTKAPKMDLMDIDGSE